MNPERFAVDRDAPVKYIVQYPLDFDFGMHGCAEQPHLFGDVCEVRLVTNETQTKLLNSLNSALLCINRPLYCFIFGLFYANSPIAFL